MPWRYADENGLVSCPRAGGLVNAKDECVKRCEFCERYDRVMWGVFCTYRGRGGE